MTTRRQFACAVAAAGVARGQRKSTPSILLRSGWQTVNIGDIAHTPGVLALIEKHIPGAEVALLPGEIDRGVEPMLLRRFPKLRIVRGKLGTDGEPDAEVREAFERASIFLHGSGPGVGSLTHFEAWRRLSRKPYGYYGVTANPPDDRTRQLLNGAAFVFTRETASLANLKKAGIDEARLRFAPDGTFSFDILDDGAAVPYMRANGLERKRFIAVVPRLRYTPYHQIRRMNWSEEEIRRRTGVNDRHAEDDHAKLREAVVAWVRRTGGKVLLCPEMTYQLDIIGPLLYDPLPEDVKPRVVRRTTYWLPDEAASVYRRAAAVVSFECHSPIIAAAVGTPCMYVHQPEDGIKGRMWRDIGLGDWYFEVEETSGEAIASRVLEIHADSAKAARKVRESLALARRAQAETMAVVREAAAG